MHDTLTFGILNLKLANMRTLLSYAQSDLQIVNAESQSDVQCASRHFETSDQARVVKAQLDQLIAQAREARKLVVAEIDHLEKLELGVD